MAGRVPALLRRALRGRVRLGAARRFARPPRALAFLALLGPGLIAANAGNDAGGIATYSSIGARYGYGLLWELVAIALSLGIVQLLAARMGAVTGKGFAELVREQYGVRWSLVSTLAILAANVGICISEFVGIGAALGLAGIPAQISVPIAALGIWLLLLRGSYRTAERFFIWLTLPFFAYPIAAVLSKPRWHDVLTQTVTPHLHSSSTYLFLVIATAGTTITPYMQIYLQSAVVERGAGEEDIRSSQWEAVSGAVFALLIAAFIVIATGATLFVHGVHDVSNAAQAARALHPVAGQYAEALFGIGLFGASVLAAAVLPVTTAYVVAEAFGFEKGLSQRPREAPVFAGVVTALVLIGALVAVIPGVPVIGLLVGVQVLNGALLPVNLFFLWRLSRHHELMGEHRSGPLLDVVAGLTALVTSGLSVLVVIATFGGL